MTPKEIIEEILKTEGVSGLELCRMMNLPEGRIKNITCGKVKKISPELAQAIVEVLPHYNYTWVISGRGEKFVEDKVDVSLDRRINELLAITTTLVEVCQNQQHQIDALLRRFSHTGMFDIADFDEPAIAAEPEVKL